MNACIEAIRPTTRRNSPLAAGFDLEDYERRLYGQQTLSIDIDTKTVWRSLDNPMATLAAMAAMSAEDAAEVAAVTVAEIEAANLAGRRDRIERGIARLALAFLCKLRGDIRTVAIGIRCGSMDDPREAADSFACTLSMNNQRRTREREIDGAGSTGGTP